MTEQRVPEELVSLASSVAEIIDGLTITEGLTVLAMVIKADAFASPVEGLALVDQQAMTLAAFNKIFNALQGEMETLQ